MDLFTNNGMNQNMMFAQLLRDKFGNDKNAAVRYVREQTGMGLQEAVRYVEMIYAAGSQTSNSLGIDNSGCVDQSINNTPMPSNNPLPAFIQPDMQISNSYFSGGTNQATPMNQGVSNNVNFNPQLFPGPTPTNYSYNNNTTYVQNNQVIEKKKDSVLSILAAVFSFVTCTYMIGIILAMIDLAIGLPTKDGKRHLGSYFALVFGFLVMIVHISTITNNGQKNTGNSYTTSTGQNSSYTVMNTSTSTSNNGNGTGAVSDTKQSELDMIRGRVFYSGDEDENVVQEVKQELEQEIDTLVGGVTAGGYEEIYNEYEKKLKEATPLLIEEYKAEAKDNSKGLEGLAELYTAKVECLAIISNEGVEKMATYMYTKGNGKYSDYEDWATKLYGVYMDEAGKLMDVYFNSYME